MLQHSWLLTYECQDCDICWTTRSFLTLTAFANVCSWKEPLLTKKINHTYLFVALLWLIICLSIVIYLSLLRWLHGLFLNLGFWCLHSLHYGTDIPHASQMFIVYHRCKKPCTGLTSLWTTANTVKNSYPTVTAEAQPNVCIISTFFGISYTRK